MSPKAYPVVSGRTDLGQISGAEVQQNLIARELSRRGHTISFVTYDYGQEDGIDCDGIRVYKMCRPHAGIPGLRFFHPQWTSLWRAMARANARVYYQRTAGCETGQCALWCRLKMRKFIFAVASDTDCDPRGIFLDTRRDRWLYRAGLRLANEVVAQTESQYGVLRRAFGIDPLLVRSCAELPVNWKPVDLSHERRRHLLWIGRISPKKRFEWLLDLAAVAPEFVIDVVMDTRPDSDIAEQMLARARTLANVRLQGRIQPQRIGEFYERAGLVICTSLVEGFPNTLMEGWARGVPSLTTFDPDGIVEAGRLGAVAASPGDLRRLAHELLDDPKRWRETSERARSYFEQNHGVESAVDSYERILKGLPI